jgi:hypothetical protein
MTTLDELNREIAERLFQLERDDDPANEPEEYWWGTLPGEEFAAHLIQDLNFADSWEGMGLVLEAMRARGWMTTVTVFARDNCEALVAVKKRIPETEGPFRIDEAYFVATAPTAPEAVARAALEALRAEEKAK